MHKMYLRIATILIFLFGNSLLSFGSLISLDDEKKEYIIGKDHFEVYEDISGTLSFDEFQNKLISGKLKKARHNHAYNENSAYWIKVDYKNISKHNAWVFEAIDHHIDEFSLYTEDTLTITGSSRPFYSRQYFVKNFVFDIPQSKDRVHSLFIRIKAKYKVGFEFKFRQTKFFVQYASMEYYFLGIYYGILFIMAIYNLLLYFSGREQVYLYYILYVIGCIFVSFEEDGIGFQVLWSEAPAFNFLLTRLIAPVLFLTSFLGYSISFLGLYKKEYRSWLRLSLIVAALYVIAQVVNVFIAPDTLIISRYYFLLFLLIYVFSIIQYRKGQRFVRFFILGNSLVFVSVVVAFLREQYIIPANILTVYAFNIGVLVEIVVLSFALSDRIRTLRKEKDKSQREIINQLNVNKELMGKVNRELEEKVRERTSDLEAKTNELELANTELRDLKDQLLEMNEKLDLDNWKLSKNVKAQTEARLENQVLSLTEFQEIYQSDEECYKHLEKMKWSGGFVCSKCANSTFSKKSGSFTRKCSKCGHENSLTAGTLFHGVRFPISKAFFLSYVETTNPGKYSQEELANIIGVHRNTCSKFLGKVRSHIEENSVKSWNELFDN